MWSNDWWCLWASSFEKKKILFFFFSFYCKNENFQLFLQLSGTSEKRFKMCSILWVSITQHLRIWDCLMLVLCRGVNSASSLYCVLFKYQHHPVTSHWHKAETEEILFNLKVLFQILLLKKKLRTVILLRKLLTYRCNKNPKVNHS
jgi:hypothetical protein